MPIILDNFSTHKTDLVKDFLEQHPNVTLKSCATFACARNLPTPFEGNTQIRANVSLLGS